MTAGDVWTTVIAGLALLLSGVSLVWQIVKSRYDRPVVSVTGDAGRVARSSGGGIWNLSVVVANVGAHTVTVLGVEWALKMTGDWEVHPTPSRPDPPFPFRLEPNDSQSWLVVLPVENLEAGNPTARPRALIVQRPSWRDRRKGIGTRRFIDGPDVELPPKWPDIEPF